MTHQKGSGIDRNASFLGRIASFKGNIAEAKELYQRYLQEKKNGKYSEGSSYYLVLQKLKDKDQDVLPSMRKHMAEFGDSSYGNHMQYQLIKYFRDKEDFSNAIAEARNTSFQVPKEYVCSRHAVPDGRLLLQGRKKE